MKNRMYNFFREDGKALILAFDFGGMGEFPIDDPSGILKEASCAGVDGILTTYGIIKKYRKYMGKAGIMLRLDANESALTGRFLAHNDIAWNIKDALPLGIDGVMCMGYVGMKVNGEYIDKDSLLTVAKVVEECDKYGLVSAAEMLPNGFSQDPKDRSVHAMKVACRCAAELGVDFVKTQYVKGFEEVTANCFAPIVALGGPYNEDTRVVLEYVKNAIDSGVKGVAIGRNIWSRKDVKGIVRALVKIIHENASVDEAMKELS